MRARYIIGSEGGAVSVTDRGLAYGDGLFETMRIASGRVKRLDLHLDRLLLGCEQLALPHPGRRELREQIARNAAGIDEGNLKLILTRGEGPRGYGPPESPTPTIILLPERANPSPPTELDVATLEVRLGENVKLAGIKHLNRLEQVLARLELEHLDADEGLMLSTSGAVIGGTSRNLFAVYGDTVKTPSVDRAGIAGVMRRSVLERCAELGIDADVCALTPDDIRQSDELFMTNALVGVQSVARLDGIAVASRSIAARLRASLALPEPGNANG